MNQTLEKELDEALCYNLAKLSRAQRGLFRVQAGKYVK